MSAVSEHSVVMVACDVVGCDAEFHYEATGEFGPAYAAAKSEGWRFPRVGADAECPGHAGRADGEGDRG